MPEPDPDVSYGPDPLPALVQTLPVVEGKPGRPSNVWRERMRKALTRAKADRVVEHIISGDIKEVIGHDKLGNPIYGDVKNADRLAAIKMAAHFAYPDLKQDTASTTLTNPDGSSLTFTLKLGERED